MLLYITVLKDKLKDIIEKHAIVSSITNQQSLKDVLSQMQVICQELNLDFDIALEKSEFSFELLPTNCDHSDAYPYEKGSVYCPKCASYIVGSSVPISYTPVNLWRPDG